MKGFTTHYISGTICFSTTYSMLYLKQLRSFDILIYVVAARYTKFRKL